MNRFKLPAAHTIRFVLRILGGVAGGIGIICAAISVIGLVIKAIQSESAMSIIGQALGAIATIFVLGVFFAAYIWADGVIERHKNPPQVFQMDRPEGVDKEAS